MAEHAANVESERDPRTPGRTAYRITGRSRDAVQAEIDRLMATVDAAAGGEPGAAQFMSPVQIIAGTWRTLGHITMHEVA